MRTIAMMRVKNEAKWIERVIRSVQPLAEHVYLFDDSSTDETPRIARDLGATVLYSPFADLNETRDKNHLLATIKQLEPEGTYVIHIDGDEELEAGGQDKIAQLAETGKYDALAFKILYLWDRPDQIRVDGIYAGFTRPSFFRLRHDTEFQTTRFGANFHCGNVPYGHDGPVVNVRLLHYGYMERETRLRKYFWYNQHDPGNGFEDYYRHIVLGDLPELPAVMQTRHAGPLTLQSI